MGYLTEKGIVPMLSRSRLRFFVFEQIGEKQWKLILTPLYAELFDSKLSDIITGQTSSWLQSRSGGTKLIIFDKLQAKDILRIEQFISDYKQFILLGKSCSIEPLFGNELDSIIALDYDFCNQRWGIRTNVGELKYQAKFKKDISSADTLSVKMSKALPRLPELTIRKSLRLTYVPTYTSRKYDLARYLTQTIAERLYNENPVLPTDMIVHPQLLKRIPKFRDLKIEEKIKMWEELYQNNGVLLGDSISGCDVVIIDDIYQSGVTLWSYARLLKSLGAASVHALVCEKTWSDHDNR